MLPEHLGQRQDEVGRRRARGQCAEETHTDHDRRGEVCGLAEDCGLGFDSARAPAQDAEAVDHRRV
jgi:hypothetical protein